MRVSSVRRPSVLWCSVVCLATALAAVPAGAPAAAARVHRRHPLDAARFVNPFVSVRRPRVTPQTPVIGTSTDGHTFPGADMPFGMVQWSPDTASNPPGGYSYNDQTITGFSLTHLSGAGCRMFGDVPFLPTTALLGASPASSLSPYDSTFSHSSEQASPGNYAVALARWGIGVQLTATTRAGMGSFSYPAGAPAHLLIDAGHSANGNSASSVSIIGGNEVTGSATSGGFCHHPGTYTVHFAVQFDHPFVKASVWNGSTVVRRGRAASGTRVGAFLSFGTQAAPTAVGARVGISFVGVDGALANLRAEIPGWSFSTVQTAATDAWNGALDHIQVSGGTPEERDVFYTALYHSMLFPSVFSDVNGQYRGEDGRVHVTLGHVQFTNVSGWDVYRSEIPLLALLFPTRVANIVRSLLNDASQNGGWLPKWPIAGMTPDVMDGDSADPIIAEAWAYGARGFSGSDALARMVRGASVAGTGADGYVEREGLGSYLQRGYVPYAPRPADLASSAATTLEYATDDFAIARLAQALARRSTWSTFMHRAQSWQALFNPATGFVQPRRSDGSFSSQFHPAATTGFREGDAWQYTWMTPQNLAALVLAMGGGDAASGRLQTFFSSFDGDWTSTTYQSANEDDLGAPWVFDFAAQPWSTQAVVREILTTVYGDGPGGLPGNDDLGAMSSWYVWAAMGLYPEIPAVAGLAVGSPLFPEIDLSLPGGVETSILAPQAADDAPYVTSLSADGTQAAAPWLPLSSLDGGGTIAFGLSTSPDTAWGVGQAPPSYTAGQAPGIALALPSGAATIGPGETRTVMIGVQSVVDAPLSGTWLVSVGSGSGLKASPGSGSLAVDPGGHQEVQIAIRASSSARSSTIVVRAVGAVPGADDVGLAPVVLRVDVT